MARLADRKKASGRVGKLLNVKNQFGRLSGHMLVQSNMFPSKPPAGIFHIFRKIFGVGYIPRGEGEVESYRVGSAEFIGDEL